MNFSDWRKNGWNDLDKDELEMALSAHNAGLEEGEPKWISVKDRLPDDGWYIVAIIRDGYDPLICLNQRRIESERGWTDRHVTHWMPLPEPPKQSGRG